MKKYAVVIREYLIKRIEVDAMNEDDAYHKVHDLYEKCEVVLSADDFDDFEIEVDEEIK